MINRFHGRLAIAMSACLLLAPHAARAGLEQDINAFFWVDTWSTGSAYAVVVFDPDTPVVDVLFESSTCEVGPMSELQPGIWTGEGPPESSYDCYDATATVILDESSGEGFGSATACPFTGVRRVKMSGSAYTEGHVCSNGRIRMSGNATIHGDARHGPRGGVSRSGNAAVTGSVETLPARLAAEPVDPGTAVFVNDNHEIPRSSRGRNPLSSRGAFRLSGHDRVALAPGTYFFTSFKLSGQSSLGIDGPTVIYVAGDFDASGGSIVNEQRLPSDLQVFVMGRRLKLSGHSDLYATVHAPGAQIQRTGGSDFYGSLLGNQLVLTGNGGLHYVAGDAPTGELSSVTMEWIFDE